MIVETRTIARATLASYVFLATYDGALRKWVLPQADWFLFLLKDAVLAAGLACVMSIGITSIPRSSLARLPVAAFLLYASWVCIETVNPNVPNVAVAVWGVKAHLLYPLAFAILLATAFSDLRGLLSVTARLYPYIVIPVCVIAVIQVQEPVDHWINKLPEGATVIAYFGEQGLLRVSGTFSFISGMAAFSVTMTLLGLGLLLTGYWSWPVLIGLASAAASLPTTGSRSVVAVTAGGAVLLVVGSAVARLTSARKLAGVVIGITALGLASSMLTHGAWEALHQRYEENKNVDQNRAYTAFSNAFYHFDSAGLIGFGTGTTNQAAPALAPAPPFHWLPMGTQFEEEAGRIMLELGAIGWVLSTCMHVVLLAWAAALVLNAGTMSARAAAVISTPFLAEGLHSGHGVFSAPYDGAAYWFVVGMLVMAQRESVLAKHQAHLKALRLQASTRSRFA